MDVSIYCISHCIHHKQNSQAKFPLTEKYHPATIASKKQIHSEGTNLMAGLFCLHFYGKFNLYSFLLKSTKNLSFIRSDSGLFAHSSSFISIELSMSSSNTYHPLTEFIIQNPHVSFIIPPKGQEVQVSRAYNAPA
jgi:aminopeptidase-like protein